MYLRQVDGPTLASVNASYSFEPASSIKALVALYAITRVARGLAKLTDQVPQIDEFGGLEDCPLRRIVGTEPLGTAIREMMQRSDNNRTLELMQYFGVGALNAFAASLGLRDTRFGIVQGSPGFTPIGCERPWRGPRFPNTLTGNTMPLVDAAKLWSDVASLPALYSDELYQLSAGRDMYNDLGYDWDGIWPAVADVAQKVLPAKVGPLAFDSFVSDISVTYKGGEYEEWYCTRGPKCQATGFSREGIASISRCVGGRLEFADYLWGYFISRSVGRRIANANDTRAGEAMNAASGWVLAAVMRKDFSSWGHCAPVGMPTLTLRGHDLVDSPDIELRATLGTFADSDPADIAQDFVASIRWGDGTTSFATVTGGRGSFALHGWHSYEHPGVWHVRLRVTRAVSPWNVSYGATTARLTITVR